MGKKQSKLDPQVMNDLLKKTDFDERELKSWYKGFLKDCPNGYLTKEQFIEMYNKVFRQGDASKLAACVFRRFDVNRDGKIGEFFYRYSCTDRLKCLIQTRQIARLWESACQRACKWVF